MLAVINESIRHIFSQVEVCQYPKQTDVSVTRLEKKEMSTYVLVYNMHIITVISHV